MINSELPQKAKGFEHSPKEADLHIFYSSASYTIIHIFYELLHLETGWHTLQKLRALSYGARRKVWTQTKILSYFVAIKTFVAIYFMSIKATFFRCNFGKIANSRLTTELKRSPKACQLLPPCLEIGQDTIIFDFWTIIWCKCWSSELLVLLLVTDCES